MTSLQLSIPGKCFLVGEYVALNQGPTLVFNSKPLFQFSAELSPSGKKPFHPFSPAGRFYFAHQAEFSKYKISWLDPHQGKGGWGASSAQFLGLHYLLQLEQRFGVEAEYFFDLHLLLNDYQVFAAGEGQTPSGADLVSQASGGITYFHRRNGKLQKFSWPFQDIGIAFIPTGHKVPTHEYLQTLAPFAGDQAGDKLEAAVEMAFDGLRAVDSQLFVSGIVQFSQMLAAKDWIAPATLELVQLLQGLPGVLAIKGCGALGADLLMIVYQKDSQALARVSKELECRKLVITCTDAELASGPEIKFHNIIPEVQL